MQFSEVILLIDLSEFYPFLSLLSGISAGRMSHFRSVMPRAASMGREQSIA